MSHPTEIAQQYQTAWAAGDTHTLRSLLAEDCTSYELVSGEERGVPHEINACQTWHAAFSDVAITIQHTLTEGDLVTVHWLLTSTHTGPFMGTKPTGKTLRVPGMEINRIREGRITEIWRLSDGMAVMQQLGMRE